MGARGLRRDPAIGLCPPATELVVGTVSSATAPPSSEQALAVATCGLAPIRGCRHVIRVGSVREWGVERDGCYGELRVGRAAAGALGAWDRRLALDVVAAALAFDVDRRRPEPAAGAARPLALC